MNFTLLIVFKAKIIPSCIQDLPNLAEMIPIIKSHIEISGVISGEVDVVSLQRVTFSPGDKVTFMKASVTS